MSILDLICVLGYTATIFGLGYMMGKDAHKQKRPPLVRKTERSF